MNQWPRYERMVYAIPVLGWMLKDVAYGDKDNIYYFIAALVMMWIIAIIAFGYPAIIIPALGLACFLMGVSQSVVLLGLAVYLLRLFGQGMMTHTSMTAMGRWYSGNRGTAVSLALRPRGAALIP